MFLINQEIIVLVALLVNQNRLHKYSYKYLNNGVGVLMRDLFEKGLIKSEEDFLVYLNKE